jgi:hypothetical protein
MNPSHGTYTPVTAATCTCRHDPEPFSGPEQHTPGCAFRVQDTASALVGRLTPAQLQRAVAAVRHVHDERCGRWPGARPVGECVACPYVWHVHDALTHLDAHPRDAAGARLILHDARCVSGGRCDLRVDHALRHADTVAALRRFRTTETPQVTAHD